MQLIKRPNQPPAILTSEGAQASRKAMLEFWQLEPERRAQTSVPAIGFTPEESSLCDALAEMSGHRCAFCEANDKLEVYRFRPAGNALPLARSSNAHLYYLWLADDWNNLLPICSGCVPSEPQFPVQGARCALPELEQVRTYVASGDGVWPFSRSGERPLLLDPAKNQPFARHLVPTLDGELLSRTVRAEATITTFDLNRSERRDQRYHVYQERLGALQDFIRAPDHSRLEKIVNFTHLEFGGTWYLLLRRLLGHSSISRTGRGLAATQVGPALYRLAQSGNGLDLLDRLLATLHREDRSPRSQARHTEAPVPAKESVAAIHIRNFKAIEQLELRLNDRSVRPSDRNAPPTPSLVILGENATGKSSILEAIALALMPAATRNSLQVPWAEFVTDPAQLGCEPGVLPAETEIHIELTNQYWARLKIDLLSHDSQDNLGNQRVPVFAYGAFRRFTRVAAAGLAHAHVRNLFQDIELSNPERWLRGLRQDRFDMVIRTLRDVLAVEGDFDVIQRDLGTGELRVVTAVSEPDGTSRFNRTPFRAVSSGYRSMLAMVCDIMRGLLSPTVYPGFESFQSARGVVLIDEIEAHLHPRWKVQVMSRLRAAFPNMTFIVTTHDPLCLRGMEQGEVAVLQRVATSHSQTDSRMPIFIESIGELPPVSDLRLEQLLTSDFFQMLSTDDAHADRRLAKIADLMSARARGEVLSANDERVVSDFRRDISSSLPIGSSEVHRIIQEVVAEYLAKRRAVSTQTLRQLRRETKDEILTALESL